MNVGLSNMISHVQVTVEADLDGASEIPRSTQAPWGMRPNWMKVSYVFAPGQRGGWWWVAEEVVLRGNTLDGVGPVQEISWLAGKTGDVQADHELPEWLDRQVSRLRPLGEVSLAEDTD